MFKKSFYIFLTSILGVLLFLILHRIVVFVYLYLMATDLFFSSVPYYQFLAWDYFTLSLTLMLGGWYGIWLGLYWYKKIYEEQSHPGFVGHISRKVFIRPSKNLNNRIDAIKQRLEDDLLQYEEMSKPVEVEAVVLEPIKKRVVRKKAPKKIKV